MDAEPAPVLAVDAALGQRLDELVVGYRSELHVTQNVDASHTEGFGKLEGTVVALSAADCGGKLRRALDDRVAREWEVQHKSRRDV